MIIIRIGDKVIIDKEKLYYKGEEFKPIWYSNEILTIIGFDDRDNEIALVDKQLPNNTGNKICISYLKLLKTDRKNKLLKLDRLQLLGVNPV